MLVTRFPLARASRVERQVLEALRAAPHAVPWLDAAALAALQALVARARGLTYQIWPAGTDYISRDELKMLGWLALVQRGRSDMLFAVDEALSAELRGAAEALKLSHLLPFQAAMRVGHAPLPAPVTADHDRVARRYRPARPWLKRDRAIAFVSERGRVSTEALCALGLSRQYISVLCGEGVLIRVCQGYYEAPRTSATGANGGLP